MIELLAILLHEVPSPNLWW